MSPQDSVTSGSPVSGNRNRQTLPPIRTVLGDQLALSTLPSPYSPHSASSRSSLPASLWESHDHDDAPHKSSSSGSESRSSGSHGQGARTDALRITTRYISPRPEPEFSHPSLFSTAHSLPPSPFPFSPNYFPSRGDVSPNTHQHAPPWAHPILPNSAPPYSYNVLRPSPSGGLITAPPITRSRKRTGAVGPSRDQAKASTSANTENPLTARRHVCHICQKRFNRPSSLRTHLSVHTGLRPFTCPQPGCGRTFSVASNMRRHLRKHSDTAPEPEVEPEQDYFGSSDGELEMEFAGQPPPQAGPAPSGHPLAFPGNYFEWTSDPRPPGEGTSTP